MPKRPALSKSEMEFFRIVWKLGQARVRDVVRALPPKRDLDFFTVQTYLRRLKIKGYLKTRREGRADVYFPAVKPKNVIRDLTADFLNRVFGGEPLPLMHHLIEDQHLSNEQIDQLQAALDDFKRRRNP
jgi:BlaI family transcriptional regulator, penicillinase repressor